MSLLENACERLLPLRVRGCLLVAALFLPACLRNPGPPPVPRGDDKSILFPPFFEHEAGRMGADATAYEFDGELLRAMMIAANDFGRSPDKSPPCWAGRGTQYRVIRQGEIIFVYVYRDLSACGLSYAVADSGAKYAISADGRILRRVMDGEPLEPVSRDIQDGGYLAVPAELGTSAEFDAGWSLDGELQEGQPDGGAGMAGPGLPR